MEARMNMGKSPSPSVVPPASTDSPPSDSATTPPLSLSADQVSSLIGGACKPGKEYTVTLRAGEMQDDGNQSFDVLSQQPSSPDVEGTPSDNSNDMPEGETPAETAVEEPAEGPRNLGFDLNKLRAARGKTKPAPPVSASSFM